MKKKEVMQRYADYRKEIVNYMDSLCDSLYEKNGDIYGEYVLSLDLLAMNLDIMMQAQDTMHEAAKAAKERPGGSDAFTNVDKYRGAKKSAATQAFFAAQTHVNRILNTFGFTPKGKSSIKENKDAQDVAKLISALTE